MNNKIIFGTDGWRGLLDNDVNEKSIAIVANAFSDYLNSKTKFNKVAVGFDGRTNSKTFAEIFSKVLSSNNISSVISDEIIPTPVLSYYTYINNFNAGVMITASHNPPEYNGIKFKANYGGPFFTEETQKVEACLDYNKSNFSNKEVFYDNFVPKYFEQIESLIDFEIIKKSGLNVLIDSMHGAGRNIIEELLKKYNCKATTICEKPLNNFDNRYPEPIEKNLIPLSNKLKSGEFSLGIATDGDADRLGVLDENGNWINAQKIILLLADYIVNHKNISGDLVKTASVTNKLKLIADSSKINLYDVQVGFKYICEEMINKNISFGAEESGGYGYGFHIPERDGILSGLLLIEALAYFGEVKISKLISKLKSSYGEIYYDRIDLKYERRNRNEILPSLFIGSPDKISDFKVTDVKSYLSSRGIINGLKLILEENTRWLLIRSSETEPLIRLYAEGETSSEVENILKHGLTIIERFK